ncbi:MAG: cysteine-rich CWC family protein [Chloroflexota bacterium]
MTAQQNANVVCPRCKSAFSCGITAGDETCWCFYYPRMKPVPVADTSTECGCLCPNCLEYAILLGDDDEESVVEE